MQINPYNEEYDSVIELPERQEEYRKAMQEIMEDGQIVATSHDKAALKKLQDDLRKAGYKRAR